MKRALTALLILLTAGALAWSLQPKLSSPHEPRLPSGGGPLDRGEPAQKQASTKAPARTGTAPTKKMAPANALFRPKTSSPHEPQPPSGGGPLDRGEPAREQPATKTLLTKPPKEPIEVATNEPPEDPPWEDPTNQKVLGPARWMAQPDEATRQALDDTIDNSPAPAEVARQKALHVLHTEARTRARLEAAACVSQIIPNVPGRVMVEADLRARGGSGVFVSPRITAVVDIDSPELRACILDALARSRFGAGDDIDLPDARFPLFF